MDVRCAQCQAEYELDDTLVAERGTAVCCTRCGFRFRAYRPAGLTPAPECWSVRTLGGATLTFLSLRDLQEAIVLRRVGPQDALTRGGGPARSLASIVEFRSLFEAAKRGGETLAKARPSMPTPAGLGSPLRHSMPLGLLAASTPPGHNVRPGAEAKAVAFGAEARSSGAPGALPFEAVGPAEDPLATLPAGGAAAPAEDPLATLPAGGAAVPADPPARASMPSMVRTIRFGEEHERPVREAVEAALGRPVGPIDTAPLGQGGPIDTVRLGQDGPIDTVRLGQGGPFDAAPLRHGGPFDGGPAGQVGRERELPVSPQVYQSEITAPLFTGAPHGQNAAPRAGEGVMSAATPQAFVASEVVTPPDGLSRLPNARSGGINMVRGWQAPDGLSAEAARAGGEGVRRPGPGGGGAAPWTPLRSPPTPPLRWFVVAAGALALVAGLAVHKGLSSVAQPPQQAVGAAAGQLDELLASAEGALGRGDVDGALDAYAKAKAIGGGDARVALGSAKAEVLRAEPLWWRLTLLPASAPAGARAAAGDELAAAAARANQAVDEAAGVAGVEGKAFPLRVDARRLAGDLAGARALVASAPAAAASDAEATYALTVLRLAEGAKVDADTVRRLREAASGEAAQGRAGVAFVYALALSGEEQAARAEFDRVGSAPGVFAALPDLRAWLEARAERAAPSAPVANPGRAPATPRRRVRPKAAPARAPSPGASPLAREPKGGALSGELEEAAGRVPAQEPAAPSGTTPKPAPTAADAPSGTTPKPAPTAADAPAGTTPKPAPTAADAPAGAGAPKPADEGGAPADNSP
jgi:zinc ribbon protein